jgi:CopG family nickel-responsive transcriptional regulator
MVTLLAKLTRFGVSLPADLVSAFDRLIRAKGYKTRSEAIGDLMRESLVEDEWQRAEGNLVGTITIIYSHEKHGLSDTLNALQHSFHDAIICTTHVHMDAHNCLEVIVVRGSADDVKVIADRLISTTGVKHGKLVCTSTGEKF